MSRYEDSSTNINFLFMDIFSFINYKFLQWASNVGPEIAISRLVLKTWCFGFGTNK